uniref:WWE domain-containing protein n=1 Tax=Denticeps clupeoides TaxID=299321 RepID=A0AAY4A678_9TELE
MDTMLLASAVVVWEWLNEHGRWRPYGPAVSHHIEATIRSDPRGGSVVLGQADSRLSPYIIDLHSMHQFRQDTGTSESRLGILVDRRKRVFCMRSDVQL